MSASEQRQERLFSNKEIVARTKQLIYITGMGKVTMTRSDNIFITMKQWAANQGITAQRGRIYAKTGRLAGALKIGRDWIVPWDAKKPKELKRGRPEQ